MDINCIELIKKIEELREKSLAKDEPIEKRFGMLEVEQMVLDYMDEEATKIYQDYLKHKEPINVY